MTAAHVEPLTPLTFLDRSASVYPDRCAIVDGDRRITFAELRARTEQFATALLQGGVNPGDRIVVLTPNSAEALVAHFAVPLVQAILVMVNTRLSTSEVGYILDHSQATLAIVDHTLRELIPTDATVPVVVVNTEPGSARQGDVTLSQFLDRARPDPFRWTVDDENRVIALNYTSGTTGRPKGVLYSHRGAHLAALAQVHHVALGTESAYLWTLPMFHCNGWCTTWGAVAAASKQVALAAVRADTVSAAIAEEGITHLSGAPAVLATLVESLDMRPLSEPLTAVTAGAPPAPTLLARLESAGVQVVHVYGLTESYGPFTICERQADWSRRPAADRSRLLARQGVRMIHAGRVRVVDSELNDVPADGTTIGEIVMRGNGIMLGYLDDEAATAAAFAGGWLHSGDLGVMHPDGYIEVRDRAKDIIISGGENISTVEVEQALLTHDAVEDAAVVGVPDDQWGERPLAFVVLRAGAIAAPSALVDHVKTRIARFKAPREVILVDQLPRTSTGKVRKFVLRSGATAEESLPGTAGASDPT